MAYLDWNEDLDTGIEIIDAQHKRIVDYINRLHVSTSNNNNDEVKNIIIELVDYTLSHFAFEESLLEESAYSMYSEHIKKHDKFRNQIFDFRTRAANDEPVAEALLELLHDWLFAHIQIEDAQYVPSIEKFIEESDQKKQSGWLKKQISRFFNT